MKNQNWQPKYKASAASAGRDEQLRVTSSSLSKLSEKEMERVVGGLGSVLPGTEDLGRED